jgi:hypothetical protein
MIVSSAFLVTLFPSGAAAQDTTLCGPPERLRHAGTRMNQGFHGHHKLNSSDSTGNGGSDVGHVSLSPDDESLDSSGAGPSISCTVRVNVRHRLGYAEQQ